MHLTAMENGKRFFDVYSEFLPPAFKVIDIGSQDVNGSLKSVCPDHANYTGIDFVDGKNVDVILEDAYKYPLESNSVDVALSSSCFEHSEFFWLSFLETMRVLKDDGLFYLNVPSDGNFHRYPVDCWRFYPDSAHALANWARRHEMNTVVLESYITQQGDSNDFVGVFLKNEAHLDKFPKRILDTFPDYCNGRLNNRDDILKHSERTPKSLKLAFIHQVITDRIKLSD